MPNREDLIKLRNTCRIRLSQARGMGLSDEEILSAIRSDKRLESGLADFIEHDILKGENCHNVEMVEKG